jgi:hypothetical protein
VERSKNTKPVPIISADPRQISNQFKINTHSSIILNRYCDNRYVIRNGMGVSSSCAAKGRQKVLFHLSEKELTGKII